MLSEKIDKTISEGIVIESIRLGSSVHAEIYISGDKYFVTLNGSVIGLFDLVTNELNIMFDTEDEALDAARQYINTVRYAKQH